MIALLLSLVAGAQDLGINDVDLVSLAKVAPNVVRGQVLATHSTATAKSIQTQYTIAVYQTYAGKSPEILTMWLPGGTCRRGVLAIPACAVQPRPRSLPPLRHPQGRSTRQNRRLSHEAVDRPPG